MKAIILDHKNIGEFYAKNRESMKIIATKEKNFALDYTTQNILECVDFWNRNGPQIIKDNKSGKLGSNETNEMSKTMQPDDFLLEMLLNDCFIFCKNSNDYIVGRNRSHIWLHQKGERVLMLHI